MTMDLGVTRNLATRVIEVKMSGLYTEADMQRAAAELCAHTDAFAGRRHMVIADMREMKAVHPSIARLMGEAIGYQRERGCVLCFHISDDTVQRLQVARIARQYSPNDDVTIDVTSLEEARLLARSYAKFLDDPRFTTSIRAAISLRVKTDRPPGDSEK